VTRGHDRDNTENLWTGLQQWAHNKAELTIQVSGQVDMPTCKQTCKQTLSTSESAAKMKKPLAEISNRAHKTSHCIFIIILFFIFLF